MFTKTGFLAQIKRRHETASKWWTSGDSSGYGRSCVCKLHSVAMPKTPLIASLIFFYHLISAIFWHIWGTGDERGLTAKDWALKRNLLLLLFVVDNVCSQFIYLLTTACVLLSKKRILWGKSCWNVFCWFWGWNSVYACSSEENLGLLKYGVSMTNATYAFI